MPRRQTTAKRLATAARWPVGICLTSWRYMWRTTPVHRWELAGSPDVDAPPPLPPGIDPAGLQGPDDGVGPLVHRLYRTRIVTSPLTPEQLVERVTGDLDAMAPSEFASFQKLSGQRGRMAVGDEYVVRMPGPWDGPVQVIDVSATSFRLATLDGHLEAGQIEFRATAQHRSLEFAIESWARSGDWLSNLLYTHVRMAKEVQLHMWTSVLERVVGIAAGTMDGGIIVTTRRVDGGEDGPPARTGPSHRRALGALAGLAGRPLNFDPSGRPAFTRENGWHLDDMTAELPHEPSGPPVEGGSWKIARELMRNYQVADPALVRATYDAKRPLAGRDMLLEIRFKGLRLKVGVRVGDVYDELRVVDGREAQVFGWDYRTLLGNFEQGQMHYEVWKWFDTGDVEFRLHAFSRVADSGPWILRLGFRIFGRRQQLDFYRRACRRMRRLTEARLETERDRT